MDSVIPKISNKSKVMLDESTSMFPEGQGVWHQVSSHGGSESEIRKHYYTHLWITNGNGSGFSDSSRAPNTQHIHNTRWWKDPTDRERDSTRRQMEAGLEAHCQNNTRRFRRTKKPTSLEQKGKRADADCAKPWRLLTIAILLPYVPIRPAQKFGLKPKPPCLASPWLSVSK